MSEPIKDSTAYNERVLGPRPDHDVAKRKIKDAAVRGNGLQLTAEDVASLAALIEMVER